jgi:hypothetical protein
MLSNFVLVVTLTLNAGAVLNFKLKPSHDSDFGGSAAILEPTLGDKIRNLLYNLQSARVFLALWNVFVMFCMVVFFGS